MDVRLATTPDREAIIKVCMAAFSEEERAVITELAVNLLTVETQPETLSWVAAVEGTVVGHVAFSPVFAEGVPDFSGYILAPLSVMPEYQGRRVGSTLIDHGLWHLKETGVGIVFVYGDPRFYGRFGFTAEVAECYEPPYKLLYPFGWQGLTFDAHLPMASPVSLGCVRSLCDPALW